MTELAEAPPAAPAPTPDHPPRRRVKAPTVLQMEATECGAASLAMVLAHHGRIVPLEELRVACGVTRDGSSAPGIMKAARAHGLEPRGYRKEPHELAALPLPQIVFWNFNHFLVVEGFDGAGGVHLNDPERGRRHVDATEFDTSFTGIVLSFDVGATFSPTAKGPGLVRRLSQRAGDVRGAVGYLLLAALALVVPGLVVPALTKVFVDEVLVGQRADVVTTVLTGLIGGAVLLAALTWVQLRCLARLQTGLTVRMSSDFVWHVLRLPMHFFAQRSTGDVAMRVGLNDQVSQVLSGQLLTSALGLVSSVCLIGLMFWFDPVLALVSLALTGINLAALAVVGRPTRELNDRLLREQAQSQSTAVLGLMTIETLKSAGTEGDFFVRWSGLLTNVINARQRVDVVNQVLAAVPVLLGALTTVAVLGIGAARVIDGSMTIGTLVAFQALLVSFLAPVVALVSLGGQLGVLDSSLGRLDDVLRSDTDRTFAPHPGPQGTDADADAGAADAGAEDAGPEDLPVIAGRVALQGVSFGYNRIAPPLIDRLDLELQPGQRVAVVGASGSGKSTIARVLSGLYPAWDGRILIDDRDRESYPREVLARSIGFVDQEIAMFAGTIRDNLTLWDDTVPEADVVRAAVDAAIHDDIAARPGGYASTVEESGRNFSGGQRQRLEIARALVRNPAVLVLDEATSALDPLTEVRIDRNLRRRGCTCLIIAHRLSTIRDCDEIIVLDRGRVAQRGTHEELRAVEGLYARLVGEDG